MTDPPDTPCARARGLIVRQARESGMTVLVGWERAFAPWTLRSCRLADVDPAQALAWLRVDGLVRALGRLPRFGWRLFMTMFPA